ncbi:hypothetical protein GBAR_LOCUS5129 [Geodia barretti]|uniref:DUF2283 domain-containing protein n=1 Tax=Geodia barretti TaxID=519541 RepID=A0AA35RAW1_GEOBA|nr:hypothetical protein GBAR_LOCUS5129 [Geodia barretti]
MNSVRITYDSEGDTLYISFGQPRGGTGYQISDQILLRLEPAGCVPVGLTIFNFLHHINSGQGIELDDVDDDLATALASKPVSQFLRVRKHNGKLAAYLREPSLREAVST